MSGAAFGWVAISETKCTDGQYADYGYLSAYRWPPPPSTSSQYTVITSPSPAPIRTAPKVVRHDLRASSLRNPRPASQNVAGRSTPALVRPPWAPRGQAVLEKACGALLAASILFGGAVLLGYVKGLALVGASLLLGWNDGADLWFMSAAQWTTEHIAASLAAGSAIGILRAWVRPLRSIAIRRKLRSRAGSSPASPSRQPALCQVQSAPMTPPSSLGSAGAPVSGGAPGVGYRFLHPSRGCEDASRQAAAMSTR